MSMRDLWFFERCSLRILHSWRVKLRLHNHGRLCTSAQQSIFIKMRKMISFNNNFFCIFPIPVTYNFRLRTLHVSFIIKQIEYLNYTCVYIYIKYLIHFFLIRYHQNNYIAVSKNNKKAKFTWRRFKSRNSQYKCGVYIYFGYDRLFHFKYRVQLKIIDNGIMSSDTIHRFPSF